jgi:hypothetical protein
MNVFLTSRRAGREGGGDETVEMKMRTCYVVVDKSARCK